MNDRSISYQQYRILIFLRMFFLHRIYILVVFSIFYMHLSDTHTQQKRLIKGPQIIMKFFFFCFQTIGALRRKRLATQGRLWASYLIITLFFFFQSLFFS